jgi:hypothetical protein
VAKLGREELLKEGERLLESWGQGAATSLADLQPLAGREAAADLAIANRLGGSGSAESVDFLRRLERESAEKLVRKEAKRALYRLEQRGVDVPEEPTGEPLSIAAPALEGYVSPIDGRGDQLIWLVKSRTGGVLHLFAVINDPEGMRETELAAHTRKGLKTLRAELEKKHELRLVETDWHYCDFLMRRAFAWARERNASVAGDFPALRAQLTNEPGADELPPIIWSRLDSAKIDADSAALASSPEVLNEPELRTWFFGPEQLEPYLRELGEIRESPLVLDRHQQEERFAAVIARAVEELFGGDHRASWARRLYELAYFFSATGRPERARSAAAAGRALERGGHGARGVPLLEQLARTSLFAFFQASVKEETERAKDSLIVTPQQVRAQRGSKRS